VRAPLPPNEQERLAALRRYRVLDTPPEEAFDRLITLARDIFDAPTALVSLVDADRQWFKACFGLDVSETGRDVSFCAHALLGDDPFVIPDTLEDERFTDNALVTGGPRFRFYAGAPLTTSDGVNLGTLCILDSKPRPDLSPEQKETLQRLAAIVMDELELRVALMERVENERLLRLAIGAAQEASRVKTQFLSGINHEFRTPLNAILGFSKLLSEEGLNEEQQEDLAAIHQAGRTLLDLINKTLDVARYESERIELSSEDVSLGDVVSSSLPLVESIAAERNVSIKLDPTGWSEAVVTADPIQLERVFVEIVKNAVHNSEAGTNVVISGQRSGHSVEVRVTDRGPGIPMHERDRIFEAFHQLESSRGTHVGIGLGLTLARRITTGLGGTITVEGTEGIGATIRIVLPLARAATQSATTVLHIDDNPSSLSLIASMLTEEIPDLQVLSASSGLEGIRLAQTRTPDLILLDLNLGDLPGELVLRHLRADEVTHDIPVVIVSAQDESSRFDPLKNVKLLPKPVDREALITLVRDKVAATA
jgi:signal transduction histidine kinase